MNFFVLYKICQNYMEKKHYWIISKYDTFKVVFRIYLMLKVVQ